MNNFAFVCSEGLNSNACQGFGDGLLYVFLIGLAAIVGVVVFVSLIITLLQHKKNKDARIYTKRKHSLFSMFLYSTFMGILTISFGSFLIIAFDLYKAINVLIMLLLLNFYIFAVKSYIKE